jgi:MFS family permease
MQTPKHIRVRGSLQLLLGLILVALMGTVTYNLAPSLLRPGGDESRFTATAEQAQLILGLFALIVTLGLLSMVSGLWQIVTGRRSKWMVLVMLLVFALVAAGAWLSWRVLSG